MIKKVDYLAHGRAPKLTREGRDVARARKQVDRRCQRCKASLVTLVVVFAIGAGWIGYMGWPLYGLITLAAEQSNSPNRPQARAVVQDPNCPGNDNHALMCRLVNEYRAKHGLKPVQLDDAVTREAQYWSDQLNRQSACWFLYHDDNYHARMRARFPGRRFRENAACSGSTGGGARFILRKWIDS